MDEGTGQKEEERMKAAFKRLTDSERTLLNMTVFKEPKDQSEKQITVEIEVDALETCLAELLGARQEWFAMSFNSTTDVLKRIEETKTDWLTQMMNLHSGELFKAMLRETRSYYWVFVIDNLLLIMLWQLVLPLLRLSKDAETMRSTMKSFVPLMQKLKDMIEEKEREPETVKGIVESFWADLQKRGVVR